MDICLSVFFSMQELFNEALEIPFLSAGKM